MNKVCQTRTNEYMSLSRIPSYSKDLPAMDPSFLIVTNLSKMERRIELQALAVSEKF